MTTLFISDLHLEETRPDINAIFFDFLANEAIHADALYILGDFFEVWVGDDDITPFHQQIIDALKKLSATTPIYFMPGNRDFLIGKRFLNASGCQLLKDPYKIDLYGTPTLLMHGNTLCTEDIAYQRFRKKVRNPIVQWFFLLKPLAKRKALAKAYREKSKNHTSTAADHILDVTPSEVTRIMQQYHVSLLIHGHTHRPAIHELQIDNKPAKRIVLGAWHEKGCVLVCTPDGKQQLRIIPDDKIFPR